jgi:hypothetical protein
MVVATRRMLRLGVVADARWDAPTLAALPKLVRGAGLDSIWCSDRAPTGPLPPVVVGQLMESAGSAWRREPTATSMTGAVA